MQLAKGWQPRVVVNKRVRQPHVVANPLSTVYVANFSYVVEGHVCIS